MNTESHVTYSHRFGTWILSLSLPLAALAMSSCKSNEPPPPLPAAKPAAVPSVANIAPEEPEADAGTEAPKKPGKGGGGGGGGVLGACCKALRQNAASAPPENQGHMLNAATMCDAANKQGLGKAAGFLAALGGAAIPAACK